MDDNRIERARARLAITPAEQDELDRRRQNAELCVRRVKDLAYDDAVVLMLETMLEVERATQHAILVDVEARLSRALTVQ